MTTKSKPMTKERVAQCPPPPALEKHDPLLNRLAGSKYDDWNTLVANQAINSALYPSKLDADQRKKSQFGPLCLLSGVEPKDELEGMLASQLLAPHWAGLLLLAPSVDGLFHFKRSGNVALWQVSDMPPRSLHVRYQGMNGPSSDAIRLPFLTRSGRQPTKSTDWSRSRDV